MRGVWVLSAAALAACSFNPLGSLGFGGGRTAPSAIERAQIDVGAPVLEDGSVLMGSVRSIVPEPALRGVIIRVTATAPALGYWGASLVPFARGEPDADGNVDFAFRAFPPETAQGTGSPRARQLSAAVFIHDDALAEVRRFRIQTAQGVTELRR